MLEKLKNEPWGARFKDTIGLVKQTFALFGKDADLAKPVIGMGVYETIVLGSIYSGILLMVFGSIGIGVLLLLAGLVMRPISFFYYARQRAKVSALAYDVIRGEDATIPKARARIKPIGGSMFAVGLIDWIVGVMRSRAQSSDGFVGIILKIVMAAFAEVWDLVSNFLIPAVVIEQKGAMAVTKDLKELKRNVPAALTGVLGFDAFGWLVSRALGGVFIILVGVGIVAPIWLFGLGTASLIISLITAVILAVASAVISQSVIGAKSVYFTLFYVSLTRPHEIVASMRGELTSLLPAELQQKSSAPPPSTTQPARNAKSAATGTKASTAAAPDELIKAVRMMRERGGSDEQIRSFLMSKGFSKQDIETAIHDA